MKHRLSALIPLALGTLLCGGCMTYTLYDGPHRPKGELAIVKLGVILSVDGGDLSYLANHKLAVLPGPHSLGIPIERGREPAFIHSFDVNLKPKHTYEGVIDRDASRKGKILSIAIVDRTDDVIVARHPPLPSPRPKPRTAAATPSPRTQADPEAAVRRSAPKPNSLGTADPPPKQTPPIPPEVIAKLRQLKRMRDEGLITQEEFSRQGSALIGKR